MAASSCQEDPQPVKPMEFTFWIHQPDGRGFYAVVRWGTDGLQDVDHTDGGTGFFSSITCRPGQRMAFQVTTDALIDITKNSSPLDSTRTFAIRSGELLKIDTW